MANHVYSIIYQTPAILFMGLLADLYDAAFEPEDIYLAIASDVSQVIVDPVLYEPYLMELEEACEEYNFPFELILVELEIIQEWLATKIPRPTNDWVVQFMQVFFIDINTTVISYECYPPPFFKTVVAKIPTEAAILDLSERLGLLV